jgi:hypothetical protein
MAHFAELDENNVVKRVIVVSNGDTTNANGIEEEAVGVSFCRRLFGDHTNWKKTSYNHKFRKTFAGRGMIYDESLDMFITQKPHESWTLDSSGNWNPPIAIPELTEEEETAGKFYIWNDEAYQSDTANPKTLGWELFTPPSAPGEEE